MEKWVLVFGGNALVKYEISFSSHVIYLWQIFTHFLLTIFTHPPLLFFSLITLYFRSNMFSSVFPPFFLSLFPHCLTLHSWYRLFFSPFYWCFILFTLLFKTCIHLSSLHSFISSFLPSFYPIFSILSLCLSFTFFLIFSNYFL